MRAFWRWALGRGDTWNTMTSTSMAGRSRLKRDAAQIWFNRGLVWCFAYFHEEAVVCFEKAVAADRPVPWAIGAKPMQSALTITCRGNGGDETMLQTSLASAFEASQAALALADAVSPAEQALIEALALRFPQGEPAELETMRAGTGILQTRWNRCISPIPTISTSGPIYAEACMNLTPWAMWDQTTGLPAKGAETEKARIVLEQAMERDPAAMAHPGILHLYVHLMEMSPTPEKALKAGDVLRTLVPDAGHLIHMPTHIDIQCGHYKNVLGVEPTSLPCRCQGPRPDGHLQHLYRLPDPQLSFRRLWRDVSGPVPTRMGGRARPGRTHPRRPLAHPVTAFCRLL